jgi:hypothetical protein
LEVAHINLESIEVDIMKLEPADCIEEAEVQAIRMKARIKAQNKAFKAESKKIFWRELAGCLLVAFITMGLLGVFFDYAFNFFP